MQPCATGCAGIGTGARGGQSRCWVVPWSRRLSTRSAGIGGTMLSYIVRRLLYAIPILLGVLIITFTLFRVVQPPEKVAISAVGPKASQVMRESFIKKHGLNKPLVEQFGTYLTNTLKFDFGESYKRGRPVAEVFKDGIAPTLLITVPGFACGILAALGLALYQVFVRNSRMDRGLTIFCVALMSIPTV